MKKQVLCAKVMAAVLGASMILGLAACGGAEYAQDSVAGTMTNGAMAEPGAPKEYGYDGAMTEESYVEESGATSNKTSSQTGNYLEDRKLIKTVDLLLETKEFDQMLGLVEGKVAELGGYIESMQTYNGSRYSNRESRRESDMTIRVPKDRLDEFLNAVSEVGNVVNRSENVEDVTLEYVDMESRKKSLETEQERLLALLENAQSLEDIIILEERLSNVRYQLESMESQLRTYDNKVNFATVYMQIQEVKELTPVVEKSVGQRLADGFMDSLKDVGNGLVEFFIWIVVHLPYLAVWALVITAIVTSIKLIIRRNRKKKAAKQKESEK